MLYSETIQKIRSLNLFIFIAFVFLVLLYTVWEFESLQTHAVNMNKSRLLIFYSKFLNDWHFSWVVNMTCRHVTFTWLGESPRLSLAQRESNVVATQRTSNFSNVGGENHPIKKVAITIGTSHSHTYTSCSCKEKVPTNMKFAVSCLLRRCYLAFNFIHFDSLRSACQIPNRDKKSGSRVKQPQ